MLMAAPPIYRCYKAIEEYGREDADGAKPYVIYMSPKGRTFNESIAKELSTHKQLVILCGHYEGVDQRVIDAIVDEEISIGDFVLTGGELAAAVMADSIVRIIPGVISDETSALSDSFQDGLLDHPVYTRPAEYKGWKVPDVLLSGNEALIRDWEFQQSMERTKQLRPDLLK